MNKVWLIIKREYLVRVRKKSFIIMTFLGPILMAALLIVPTYLANKSVEKKYIAVEDDGLFSSQLKETELLNFTIIPEIEANFLKQDFSNTPYYAMLSIKKKEFTLYSNQQISLAVQKELVNQIDEILMLNNLKNSGIKEELITRSKVNVNIKTKIIDDNGMILDSNPEISAGIGFISGILIYMFIFMYGTMVMRGVIEEKTNRIIEIIISSVKPFQLMLGKIIGVAIVGFTQFFLWILLTLILSVIAEFTLFESNINEVVANQSQVMIEIRNITSGINIDLIFTSFIFYFLGGYLLYSSLFAAVGAAVDSESDTQQFILPITIPLILSFILIQSIIDNPDGVLAFWMSIIPFTSPVIMMVRLPFGVETWELVLSICILISTFILSTLLASKIYRTGILMYGKKITFKEIYKWLNYKP